MLILRVEPNSPADRADFSRGDLVVQVDGTPVHSIGDLERAVRGAGSEAKVSVLRGAEPRELTVHLD